MQLELITFEEADIHVGLYASHAIKIGMDRVDC